jgi:2'-5' RNA ligase
MVHSIELTLDAGADAAVRELWQALSEAGVPSQAGHRSPTNRPHVTVTVAAQLSADAEADLVQVVDRLPLPCRLGAPMVFGRGPYTLVLLVIPSPELLDLHVEVNRICLPHMQSGPLAHAMPGQWTPHVTLARRMRADLLEQALTVVGTGTDITGEFAGLRHWDGDARQEHPIS